MSDRVLLLTMVCTLWPPLCSRALGAGAPPDVETIIRAVRLQEEGLLNVQVDAHYETDAWDSEAGEWRLAGQSDLTAWFTGMPGSRVRVDFHKSVARWINGPAPYGECAYRVAYNGQVTKRLETSAGPLGSAHSVLDGELAAGRPLIVREYGDFAAGWRFSVSGALDDSGVRLSRYLSEARQSGRAVSVSETQFDGNPCVAVQVDDGGEEFQRFYFDPGRAFSLAGVELGRKRGAIGHKWTVADAVEVAPGVFYPTAGVRELLNEDGSVRERSTYTATAVMINDPAWTDDVFDPEWPPNTFVNDRIAGTAYAVGAAPEQIKQAVDQQIAAAAANTKVDERPKPPASVTEPRSNAFTPSRETPTSQPERRPVSAPADVAKRQERNAKDVWVVGQYRTTSDDANQQATTQPGASETDVPADHVPPASGKLTRTLIVAVLGAGAGVAFWKLRRRSGSIVGVVILACILRSAAVENNGAPALTLGELRSLKLSNSGLNAAVIVCRDFMAPYSHRIP